jgi:hypothetical protein
MNKRDLILVIAMFLAAFVGAASWQLYKDYQVKSTIDQFFHDTGEYFKSLTDVKYKGQSQEKAEEPGNNQSVEPPSEEDAAQARKREAFKAWYQTPVECLASKDNPNPDLVECANRRIRAWNEFSKSYD